jgi:hypothetical protein
MLKEVLILQTVADRENLLEDNVGKRNILFSYQKAMGTYGKNYYERSMLCKCENQRSNDQMKAKIQKNE